MIVGGVTRVIPLTGVTLPFVSYGGSSIVANFVLLALLLMVSEQARAPRARRASGGAGGGVNARSATSSALVVAAVRGADRLHVVLVGVRRRRARGEPGQQAAAARGAADPARADPRARRRRVLARNRAERRGDAAVLRARLSAGRPVRAPGGLQLRGARARRARARVQRRPDRQARTSSSTILDELRGQRARGRRRRHDARPAGAARGDRRRSPGAPARSSRSSRRPGGCA